MKNAAGLAGWASAIAFATWTGMTPASGERLAGEESTAMNYEQIIERYYAAYRDADREALREVTTPDLRHVSDFATHTDREKMIEAIWDHVGQSRAEELRIFGEYPAFMVRFRVVGGDRPARHMAEYIRFDGDRIAEVEVFVGRETD